MDIVVPAEYQFLYEESLERPVVKIPAPVLRKVAQPVKRVDNRVRAISENMARVLRKAHGVGIAAPQLGVSLRICIVTINNRPVTFINPVILERNGIQKDVEGCLSIPGLYGEVERAMAVTVEALDRKGRTVTYELEGYSSRVAQHEIDHLDGVLFIDTVDPATLYWELPAHEVRED